MTTWLNDTFTDADLTDITAHNGELGAVWTAVTGYAGTTPPKIYQNRLFSSVSTNQFYLASGVATADGEAATVSVHKFEGTSSAAGAVIRGDLTSGNLYFAWTSSGGDLYIQKKIGSTITTLASGSTSLANGADIVLKLRATGTGSTVTLDLLINGSGTPILTYADTASDRITTLGKAGIFLQLPTGGDAGVHINSVGGDDPSTTASFNFVKPSSGRIHQRVGGTGTVIAEGTYTGSPTSIQARLVLAGTSTVVSGFDWATKVATPSGNAFAFNFLSVPEGDYNIQMRDSAAPGVVTTSNKVGVGRLYLYIGQSNASLFMGAGSSTLTPNPFLRAHGYLSQTYPPPAPTAVWTSPNTATADGAISFGNSLATAFGVPIGFLDLAVSGSGVDEWHPTTGALYDVARDTVNLLEGKLEGVVWIQGENEANGGMAEATYKGKIDAIFAALRSEFGQSSLPIAVVPLHAIPLSGYTTDANIQAIRNAQIASAAAANNYRVDRIDIPTQGDGIHHTAAGFVTLGARIANVFKYVAGVATFYRGPHILSAAQVSATVFDVTLSHEGGTDFTPTSSITGWRVLDGASVVTVSSAVRQAANRVRLTLASDPVAAPVIQYLYGKTPDYSAVLRDNSALAMPLESNDGVTAGTAYATTVTFTVVDAAGVAVTGLTGLDYAFYDQPRIKDALAPVKKGTTLAISGGSATIDITGVTTLTAGGTGRIEWGDSAGTKHGGGQVVVS